MLFLFVCVVIKLSQQTDDAPFSVDRLFIRIKAEALLVLNSTTCYKYNLRSRDNVR